MRKPLIPQFPIRPGSHPSRDDGMCAMEMVAWLAGERHSDGPDCTCPVIAAYVRALNDILPSDEVRDRLLRRRVPMLINTADSLSMARQRGFMAADFLAKEFAPLLFADAGNLVGVEAMRSLSPVINSTRAHLAAIVAEENGADRNVVWTLRMAAKNLPAQVWVAGVARAIKDLHGDNEVENDLPYRLAFLLLDDMVSWKIPTYGPALK